VSKKVILSFTDFKRYAGSSSIDLIHFLTNQKIGKVEFTTKPYKTPIRPTTSITKWVIDLQKGLFLKLVDGKEEHSEKQSVGELIGEIMDLISMDKSNEYSSIAVYRRTGIPKHESNIQKVKRMIREAVLKETPQQNKTVKSLLDKWTNEHTTDREEYLYLLSKITEEALRDANFYHNGVLTKIPNIFRVKPTFDGSNLDKLGFKFGTTVAQKCDWTAADIIGAIEFFLRMNGYQSVADNLIKLLEE